MYLQTKNEYECCGCSACMNTCPKGCITMVPNAQGFLYPTVDETACIKCGLCEKVCKFDKAVECDNTNPSCYYGWHKDKKLRAESTSGAAFVAITQVCQDLGCSYFCGAVYDDDLKVKHILSNNSKDILSMRTSKYVQSDLKRVFTEIKSKLKNGEKVLFSGTPCQADGLCSYVGKHLSEGLLTVSLVCHGVSSPECFERYKDSVEKSNKSKIKSIRFRDKRLYNGEINHRFTTVTMADGEVIASTENSFTLMFGLGFMHRKSCSRCKYATPLRNCDITIGDFWGIQMEYPELTEEVSKGISLVLAHSDKGQAVCELLKNYMYLVKVPSYKSCMNGVQQQLTKPFEENKAASKFMNHVISGKDYITEAGRIQNIRKVMRFLSKFKLSNIKKSLKYRFGILKKSIMRMF